jgi:hypothetical protein
MMRLAKERGEKKGTDSPPVEVDRQIKCVVHYGFICAPDWKT